jgi:hypothetical protein
LDSRDRSSWARSRSPAAKETPPLLRRRLINRKGSPNQTGQVRGQGRWNFFGWLDSESWQVWSARSFAVFGNSGLERNASNLGETGWSRGGSSTAVQRSDTTRPLPSPSALLWSKLQNRNKTKGRKKSASVALCRGRNNSAVGGGVAVVDLSRRRVLLRADMVMVRVQYRLGSTHLSAPRAQGGFVPRWMNSNTEASSRSRAKP